MDLLRFRAEADAGTNGIDGRIKTIVLLAAVLVSATVSHWQLALLLWMVATAFFILAKLRLRDLFLRLLMPFGIAWLVFLSTIFTNGSHPFFVLHFGSITITAFREGSWLGILLCLRILASVSFATLLAFTTPMIEILETLRLMRIPGTIIDLAGMMYRYLFLLEETARTMRSAQLSRLGNNGVTWSRLADTARIAATLMIKSLDRSTRIYMAMLARGYTEDAYDTKFFTQKIIHRDIFLAAISMLLLVAVIVANLCWK